MKQIQELIKATQVLRVEGNSDTRVSRLAYDSRRIAPGDCFFAVSGTQSDGHAYIDAAVAAGAVAVVCQRLPEHLTPSVCYVVVADTNAAMADMAAAFYGDPSRQLKLVGITGTNGKTTVSNLLADTLEKAGHRVLINRAGSNVASGIATALLKGCNLAGRVKDYDMAVLEVDERSSVRVYPYITPDYIAVTNLFRDSIMRNAHADFIAGIISRSVPAASKLVLNADDLISCGLAPENPRVYFGIDRLPSDTVECVNHINDMRICPKCAGKLRYEYRRYHHIGRAVCQDCGFHSPDSDYLATNVDIPGGTMTIREDGKEYPYTLICDSVFNVYNMVTVIAVLRQLGYAHDEIARVLSQSAITESRHNVEQAGNVTLVREMAKDKNALACSRVFQYIASRPGKKEVMLLMNSLTDVPHWSENVCWFYDTDFEYLADESIVRVVCTGLRCEDYKLRCLMAGVPEDRLACAKDEHDAAAMMAYEPGDELYVLYGTDTLELAYQVYDQMKDIARSRAAEQEVQA